jgi:excisionase family DNA binding protein
MNGYLQHAEVAMGKHFYPEIRPQDRLSFHINDACVATGLSRSTFYNLAKVGKLRLTKVAGRTLILKADLDALLHGKEAS